jgi:hypothetical protein
MVGNTGDGGVERGVRNCGGKKVEPRSYDVFVEGAIAILYDALAKYGNSRDKSPAASKAETYMHFA